VRACRVFKREASVAGCFLVCAAFIESDFFEWPNWISGSMDRKFGWRTIPNTAALKSKPEHSRAVWP